MNELTTEQKKKVQQVLAKASKDPVLFVNKFLYTFNPKQHPYHLPFILFPFQEQLVKDIVYAIENGEDIFVDKSRDMGVTYTTLAVLLWFWRFVPGSNFLVGSRKEDYVDNRGGNSAGANKEESLFGKMEYMLTRAASVILPVGFQLKKHMTYMSLVNPDNGNIISGESSNPNFSRGGRYKAILLDEFAFWDNDTAAWGATADTSDCRIVVTTAGIKPGKAKRLRFGKDGEKIRIVELDHELDPRKDDKWEARERERRSAEDYAREVGRNWEGAIQGRVYDEIKYISVGDFPYQPAWSLYVSWDFGLDGTSIGWWQINPITGKPRLVDSFHTSEQPIQFFFPLFGRPIDSSFTYTEEELVLIESVCNWKKAVHFGDPDVSKRAYSSKETSSTRSELANIGIYVQTKPESNTFVIRREKTKLLLQNGVEVNTTLGNDYWREAMSSARYPQRSENSQATSAIVLPIHDWTSHPRTSTEYFAVNISETRELGTVDELPPDDTELFEEGYY